MSKKTSQPQTSPQPGGGVDFLVRTMLEREATGKRPIRPKNVEDLLQSSMQDESDDPDFDCKDEDSDSDGSEDDGSDEGSNNSESDDEDKAKNDGDGDSDESDDEDYQEKEEVSSSNNEDSDSSDSDDTGSGSDSDEPETTKKSALRETLQKLNSETNDFMIKRPVKKKRKKVKPGEKQSAKKSAKSSQKKVVADSKSKKSKSSKPTATDASGKPSKVLKKKKVLLAIAKKGKKLVEKKKNKKGKKTEDNVKPKKRSIGGIIQNAHVDLKENRREIEVTKPICSACLGDKSDDSNEIVECDSCGISVHESCYGLFPDSASVSSGSGSSSCTDPWFCDVCKSDSENIFCELCPVEGGLFKESTAGRWVHLVCAMYTQGVALHHDSSINLYNIHYTRWGSHNCAACESERQAQTGIVISCDAGMCRTYFHATCAQKHGLLSDPNQVDFAEADPYYVSCKLHTNRETMKRRIKLFNALQEQLRIKKERKELEGLPSGTNTDQARIFRKLNKVREKTALRRAQYLNSMDNVPSEPSNVDQGGFSTEHNLPTTWINGNKKQRLLHTSAKLGSDFLRKTDRLGEDLVAHELEVKHEKIIANVKRKWNVLPGMSVEYAAYYMDRENRISGLIEQYDKSVEKNHELMDKDISLKDIWETHAVNQMAMQEETEGVSNRLESLVSILQYVCPGDKKLSAKLHSLAKPKELAASRRKSPSMSRGDRKSPTPRRSSMTKKSQKNRFSSPSRSGKITIAVCDTCSKSDSQHLITRCDKCGKHYHLGCLDPPLSRMPKRTRLCGWMCSDCCDAPSETDDQVDTEAPRTLRGRTKIHKPRKYRGSDDSEDENKQSETDGKPVTKKRKSHASSFSSPESNKPTSNVDPLPLRMPKGSPDRRRRSGSASIPASSPLLNLGSPVANGPIIKSSLLAFSPAAKVKCDPQGMVVLAAGGQTQSSEPKAKKVKTKKSATPEVPKRQNQEEVGTVKKKSVPKRKSSAGPLTTFKVNGLDTSIPKLENGKPVVLKPKRSRKKKSPQTPSIVSVIGDEVIKSEPVSVVISIQDSTETKVKLVKAKKPRKKKKDLDINSDNQISTTTTEENSAIKVEKIKIKKPRKKKDKTVVGAANTSAEVVSASSEPEKKKKKSKANKKIIVPGQSTAFAARDQSEVGVNMVMEKVTSRVLVSKLKNGAVKPTKKRKLPGVSPQPPNATTGDSSSASGISSITEVKEKCIPPKKRKRAPSNAQLQSQQSHNNSVDNIIEAVSTGKIPGSRLENGDCELGSNDLSVIMQGISPNRQLSSGQNIMQGKAMGHGVNSGEMVTVDTSFLLDAVGSNESAFTNSPVTTFYSSNHTSTTVADGMSSFQIQNTATSSSSGSATGNYIRLHFHQGDSAPSSTPDSVAMPPPPPASASNILPRSNGVGVCATCTKSGDHITELEKCDKCGLDYHFACLKPPLKYSPRKKGQPWFCLECGCDEETQENGIH